MNETSQPIGHLRVLANEEGRILAAVAPGIAGDEDAPVLEFEPGPGQVIREVEVPVHCLDERGPNVEMLAEYRLDLSSGSRLVHKDSD